MFSVNEWDHLKTVIVSRANDSTIPFLDPSLRLTYYAHIKNVKHIKTGPLPSQVIEETNEDLEKLVSFLHSERCSVYRTDPVWKPKFTNFRPRDNAFVYDKLALIPPMPVQIRREEYYSISGLIEQYIPFVKAPMKNGTYDMYNAKVLEDHHTTGLFNKIPLFDGSNILRANDDLFYLVSNTANLMGADYLQSLLPDKRVHVISNLKTHNHIHNTIIFLREGLMLVNPNHIQHKEQLPTALHSWDMIQCPKPEECYTIEGYPDLYNYYNMDLLVVHPNLVVLEENQISLQRELEKYNIFAMMLPLRHIKTLGGGFRSVTLDLIRKQNGDQS